MTVKLLTEHHLEFLSLKGGRTGSSESTLVKHHLVGNHMSRLKYNFHDFIFRLVTSGVGYHAVPVIFFLIKFGVLATDTCIMH